MHGIRVGAFLHRAAAIVADGIGRPGVDVTFIEAVVVGIKAVLGPFQMQLQRGQQDRLQPRIGSMPPGAD